MFRDVYKQACDDIKPRDGLLADILSSKNTAKKPERNFKVITSYAASVAAVFVIAAAVVVYPNMLGRHNEQKAADEAFEMKIQSEAENTAAISGEGSDLAETADNEDVSPLADVNTNELANEKRVPEVNTPADNSGAEVIPQVQNNDAEASDITDGAETFAPADGSDNIIIDTKESAAESVYTETAEAYEVTTYEAGERSRSVEPEVSSISGEDESSEAVKTSGGGSTGGGGSKGAGGSGAAAAVAVAEFDFGDVSKTGDNVVTDGFVNVEVSPVIDGADAVSKAKNEASAEYDDTDFAYDTQSCVWRVRFFKEDAVVLSVYMNMDGQTVLIVK